MGLTGVLAGNRGQDALIRDFFRPRRPANMPPTQVLREDHMFLRRVDTLEQLQNAIDVIVRIWGNHADHCPLLTRSPLACPADSTLVTAITGCAVDHRVQGDMEFVPDCCSFTCRLGDWVRDGKVRSRVLGRVYGSGPYFTSTQSMRSAHARTDPKW